MSVRREIRLRKEFLLKKQRETDEVVRGDKKRKLKSAMDEGKSIPTEILDDARELYHESELEIIPSEDSKNLIDDEYLTVGIKDPKVCITTSRDPSSRLKQFAKEIKLCIPNSQSINRGTYRIDELIEASKKADFTDVILLNETRGQPDGLIVCHLPFGPTAYFTITNSVLRHDIPDCSPASQAYPHLIFNNLTTKIGSRIQQILQALYPIPKSESKRVITFANGNDFISFRHHIYSNPQGKIILQEAGPRFELQPYEVRLGTVENDLAEKEWVMKPYMNTSRKRQTLG